MNQTAQAAYDPADPLLRGPGIVNPYLIGRHLIGRRLLWDFHPESWRSRAKLRKLRNSARERKAVILCNGPSLNRVDLESLKDIYCFGLNKIHLVFPRTSWRPSAIVAVNRFVIEQAADFYNGTDIPLFLDSGATGLVRSGARRIFLPQTAASRVFARDCSMSVYQGNTVTYVALQLAFHMGFESVALVGCDHYFEDQGPANKVVQAGDRDPNHFDPAYFTNVAWQLPDLFESEISYRMADKVYRASGRMLVNATDGGRLEVLPRMTLADFLAAPQTQK